MSIERLDTVPRWSEAVVFGDLVFIAGQTAAEAGPTIQAQSKAVFTKIDDLLARTGTARTDLLKADIFIASESDRHAFNDLWASWVPSGAAPARQCVRADLPNAIVVEISLVVGRRTPPS